jgi:tetratricopeptide (TPR) repeat protein
MSTIPVGRITEKLDELFSRNDLSGAEAVLDYWDSEARKIGDIRGLVTVLSEKVGLYRRLGYSEKGLESCENALSTLDDLEIRDTVSGATVILNCATTMKAFGKAEEALPLYEEAKKVFENSPDVTHFLLAGLYNNTATAYSELGMIREAEELYLKAVDKLKSKGVYGEIAVSYVNLAVMLADADPFDVRAYEYMDMAEELLLSESLPHDGNYAFICSKCFPAFSRFGYFVTAEELEKRSKDIYERN